VGALWILLPPGVKYFFMAGAAHAILKAFYNIKLNCAYGGWR
jgi:hypothetical protein